MDSFRNSMTTWLGSPNEWPNRNNHSPNWISVDDPSFLIYHVTVCTEAVAIQIFEDPNTQRSAHYLAKKNGTGDQFVDEGDAAWASGSGWMNENATQIETERTQSDLDTHAAYPEAQLLFLMKLGADIVQRRSIPATREWIIGHNEVPAKVHKYGQDARGWPSTSCPDDLPLDLIVKGINLILAGHDPASLFNEPPAPPPAPPETVKPASPVEGVVYDTPTNDRSFLDYNTVMYVPGKVADIGLKVSWDEAKKIDGKWLLHITGGTWGLWDDCVDDGGFDPPHFKPTPTPFIPPITTTTGNSAVTVTSVITSKPEPASHPSTPGQASFWQQFVAILKALFGIK